MHPSLNIEIAPSPTITPETTPSGSVLASPRSEKSVAISVAVSEDSRGEDLITPREKPSEVEKPMEQVLKEEREKKKAQEEAEKQREQERLKKKAQEEAEKQREQ